PWAILSRPFGAEEKTTMSALLEIAPSSFDRSLTLTGLNEEAVTAEAEVAISIRSLRKSYGKLEAVRGIELEIQRGEIFGLIGPDGAGKTSIFQILGGVMPASAGEAIVCGQTAREGRSMIGYLTQAFSLYQDLSVAENLRYVGQLRKLSKREINERGQ